MKLLREKAINMQS